MHTYIRLATGRKYGNGPTTCIEPKDGTIIMEKEKILVRWYEYISVYTMMAWARYPESRSPITHREGDVDEEISWT